MNHQEFCPWSAPDLEPSELRQCSRQDSWRTRQRPVAHGGSLVLPAVCQHMKIHITLHYSTWQGGKGGTWQCQGKKTDSHSKVSNSIPSQISVQNPLYPEQNINFSQSQTLGMSIVLDVQPLAWSLTVFHHTTGLRDSARTSEMDHTTFSTWAVHIRRTGQSSGSSHTIQPSITLIPNGSGNEIGKGGNTQISHFVSTKNNKHKQTFVEGRFKHCIKWLHIHINNLFINLEILYDETSQSV